MSQEKLESIKDLMAVVSSNDIGLVIFDLNNTIRVWNLFMVTHSGKSAEQVMGNNLFEQFPDIAEDWFKEKSQQCISNKIKLVSAWEERPYLFKFANVRKRAKSAAYMYQNITYIPLVSSNGKIENFAITISDVTDIAASTQQLDAVVSDYNKEVQNKS